MLVRSTATHTNTQSATMEESFFFSLSLFAFHLRSLFLLLSLSDAHTHSQRTHNMQVDILFSLVPFVHQSRTQSRASEFFELLSAQK